MNQITNVRRPRKMARAPYTEQNEGSDVSVCVAGEAAEPAAAKAQTKARLVEDLLRRESGASLAQLGDATGWQPHTCRAFLTGLRKRGKALEKAKRDDGVTIYRLTPPEVSA